MSLAPYYSHNGITFYQGHVIDVWRQLPPASIQCCVTSIPYYGLRSYSTTPQIWGGDPACDHTWVDQARYNPTKHANPASYGKQAHLPGEHAPTDCGAFCAYCQAWRGELGQEPTPDLFVAHIVAVFRAVRQALRPDGTLWLNIGDSYANDSKWGGATGGKHVTDLHGQTGIGRTKRAAGGDKQLLLMPARVALALQADGWVLRNEIIWHKTAPMPESVQDRFTRAHEQVFVFAQQPRYFMDMAAVAEPTIKGAAGSTFTEGKTGVNGLGRVSQLPREDATTRNPRDVWTLGPEPTGLEHYAAYPTEIPRRAILAGTSARGACPACGAPWRRVTERRRATYAAVTDPTPFTGRAGLNRPRPGPADSYVLAMPQADLAARLAMAAEGREAEMRARFGSKWDHWTRTDSSGARVPTFADAQELEGLLGVSIPFDGQAGGWQPGCRCNAGDPVPCLVADPFLGSGTSAAVAYTLGRAFVGGDLNAQYLDLAVQRLAGVTPWYARPDRAAEPADLGPLFALCEVPA